MYWPLGAPQVYAVSPRRKVGSEGTGSKRHTFIKDGIEEEEEEAIQEERQSQDEGMEQLNEKAGDAAERNDKKTNGGEDDTILGLKVARTGLNFVTMTKTGLAVWQTKPTVVLAAVERSQRSMNTYGENVHLILRPDGLVIVVQTALGFLITYSVIANPSNDVYRLQFEDHGISRSRRHSINGVISKQLGENGAPATVPTPEVHLRFRMVIKIDAGINKALAIDEEIMVATERPAAIQCIRWSRDEAGNQTSTELQSRLGWIAKNASVVDMIHDRPMNLSTWITSDGKAYAVQRSFERPAPGEASKRSYKGYCFHTPENDGHNARKLSINARFSLLAVGCEDGSIAVYQARDYDGNIPLSHRMPPPASNVTTGELISLTCSPDGYCLFAGYRGGWAIWSVLGKLLCSSFTADKSASEQSGDMWLIGVNDAHFIGAGAALLILPPNSSKIWALEMARSGVTGCFASSNVARPVLQTANECLIYRGYDVPDVSAISAEASLWHHVQIPATYLLEQWPIRSVVVSSDGRYVAVAGRRGLTHYSVASNRWKTFEDQYAENQFSVRGGMCWHQHFLIAAVETGSGYELRVFSREHALHEHTVAYSQEIPAPVAVVSTTGEDSILAYSYDNVLRHYIFSAAEHSVKLIQVGEIAFHGIIRAPARVRSISWILPDEQLRDGDPSQDVATATVLFLVDGQLVLLQPSTNEQGDLKYEMRIIAHKVEFYILGRDMRISSLAPTKKTSATSNGDAITMNGFQNSGLNDSLWFYDGTSFQVWNDVQECLTAPLVDIGRELPSPVQIKADFYPMCPVINKGFICGAEPELIQRRDLNISLFRVAGRTHLFLPAVLRHHLSHYDSPAALHLSHRYQNLPYWSHALEILLHDVLDEEVESQPEPEAALLPSVLSFLSSFPQYLDIIVQCTRKTEVRSWRTLFAHLPPPQDLFDESLEKGWLKTAGGYLLIMHNLEELNGSSSQLIRLLSRAKEEGDWELCKELARFLMALDQEGELLREAMRQVDLPVREREHEEAI